MLTGLAAVLVAGVGVTPATADESTSPSLPAPSTTGSPTTEPAEPEEDAADVTVEVSVPDETYLIGDEVPLTVTIRNIGTADAHGVVGTAFGEGDFYFYVPREQWQDYAKPDGATLEPGAEVTLDAVGEITSWSGGEARVRVGVQSPDDTKLSNNADIATLDVVPPSQTHLVDGVVFGDANDNGSFESGEGLAGAKVSLSGGGQFLKQETGADGRFAFTDVPAGVYTVEPTSVADGWIGDGPRTVRVDGSDDHTGIELLTRRPLSDVLVPTVDFTERSYQAGDTADITITLTNEGHEPLRGVRSFCSGAGNSNEMYGRDFGDLAWRGEGVTIPATSTETYHVTGLVPEGAADYGFVSLHCNFGRGDNLRGWPSVGDRAKVPGRSHDVAIEFYHDRDNDDFLADDELVPGVTVGLRDRDVDSPMLTAVTGDNGLAKFTGVPAGTHDVEVFGPWRIQDRLQDGSRYEPIVSVHAEWGAHGTRFEIVPGPDRPVPGGSEGPGGDGETDQTGTPSAPAPENDDRAADVDGLASTGVDALTLGGIGAVVLLAGVGAVIVTRRRRGAGQAD